MKRIFIALITLSLVACASGNQNTSQEEYRYPNGKTQVDWENDWQSCAAKTGRISGILLMTPIGIIQNKVLGADSKYNSCMAEKGW